MKMKLLFILEVPVKSIFNRKYNIISFYVIMVVFLCLMVYRFTFTWDDTVGVIGSFLQMLSPFVIALFIAYFISPMVNFFENRLISKLHIGKKYLKSTKFIRMLSLLISYIIIIGTVVFLLAIIIPQLVVSIGEITTNAPDNFNALLSWLETAEVNLAGNKYVIDLSLMDSFISDSLPHTFDQFIALFNQFIPEVLNATKIVANGVLNIVFGLIIAVYLIYNKESYLRNTRKIITALLPLHRNESFFKTLGNSHRIFSNFFVGKLIDSLIIGIMCFVIMLIAKIPYAMLISVIVGVTNMIPYFGPFIGGGIGGVFLLISAPKEVLLFAVIIIALQQFDANILGPKILGDSTGLTPFWVIFAIILFGGMFGLLGMFIGVPCFAVIKHIFDIIIDRRYREKMTLAQDNPDDEIVF